MVNLLIASCVRASRIHAGAKPQEIGELLTEPLLRHKNLSLTSPVWIRKGNVFRLFPLSMSKIKKMFQKNHQETRPGCGILRQARYIGG
jgi:hypothetical protein